jgi:hypothetical protein
MTKSWHAQRLLSLKIIQLWVFIADMKNDNQEQICIIFDESYKDVDITILKYFVQVLTPILPEAVVLYITW